MQATFIFGWFSVALEKWEISPFTHIMKLSFMLIQAYPGDIR